MRKGIYLGVRTLFHWQTKLLMARNIFQFLTENNPAWGTERKSNIPDVNWSGAGPLHVTAGTHLKYALYLLPVDAPQHGDIFTN